MALDSMTLGELYTATVLKAKDANGCATSTASRSVVADNDKAFEGRGVGVGGGGGGGGG